MKRFIISLMVILAVAINASAQNLIAVQHGGAPKFYTKLPDAITAALAGDTVYVPGGSFDAITISKKLFLIGAGHSPDSTKATSRTIISSITLAVGADNGLITGMYIPKISSSDALNTYTISRCKIDLIAFSSNSRSYNNIAVTENILGEAFLYGNNNIFCNNIITGPGVNISGGRVENNIFLYYDSYGNYLSNCFIENNFFENASFGNGLQFNAFAPNSLFYNNYSSDPGLNSQGFGNFIISDELNTVFLNYDRSNIGGDGIDKQNFHLPANSPYKNAGIDNTDLGIYGGAFPWKDGSAPFNPHIQSLNVAPQTDASGNLKVQITVTAQNN